MYDEELLHATEMMDELEVKINEALGDEEMNDDEKSHKKACIFSYVISNNCTIKEAIRKVL